MDENRGFRIVPMVKTKIIVVSCVIMSADFCIERSFCSLVRARRIRVRKKRRLHSSASSVRRQCRREFFPSPSALIKLLAFQTIAATNQIWTKGIAVETRVSLIFALVVRAHSLARLQLAWENSSAIRRLRSRNSANRCASSLSEYATVEPIVRVGRHVGVVGGSARLLAVQTPLQTDEIESLKSPASVLPQFCPLVARLAARFQHLGSAFVSHDNQRPRANARRSS